MKKRQVENYFGRDAISLIQDDKKKVVSLFLCNKHNNLQPGSVLNGFFFIVSDN